MNTVYIILTVLAAFILLTLLWCLIEPLFLDKDKITLGISPDGPSSDELTIRKLPINNKNINRDPDLKYV